MMLRILTATACLVGLASGYSLGAPLRPAVARHGAATAMVGKPSSTATTVGAAAAGGILGVQLTGELSTSLVLAIAFAYGSTLSNGVGTATQKIGTVCAKVFAKTLDLNEQYEVVAKTKSALDTTVSVASNLDSSYGVTKKLDDQLKLSASYGKAASKVEELKASVTGKVEDLKAKASSS